MFTGTVLYFYDMIFPLAVHAGMHPFSLAKRIKNNETEIHYKHVFSEV
jgi:hypothetical protein